MIGKECQTNALHNSFGFAPLAMPWIETNEHWKGLRKALQGCFSKSMLEIYASHFKTCSEQFVKELAEKDGLTVNLREEIQRYTWATISHAMFGATVNAQVPYVHGEERKDTEFYCAKGSAVCDYARVYVRPEAFSKPEYRHSASDPEAKQMNENLNTVCETIKAVAVARIKELDEGSPAKKTITDAAIGLLKDGTVASAEELVHHAYALLLGGNENVGCVLTTIIYHLIKNPEIADKMREEIVETFMEGEAGKTELLNENLTNEDVNDLEYSNMVVREALRMNAPTFGKSLVPEEDIKLGELTIKAGTHVWLHNHVHSFSADVWPQPTEFKPERFDNKNELFKTARGEKRNPSAWLPFSNGPRFCLGNNYVQIHLKIAMAYLLTHFDFEGVDMPADPFFYFLNKEDFKVKVKKRN